MRRVRVLGKKGIHYTLVNDEDYLFVKELRPRATYPYPGFIYAVVIINGTRVALHRVIAKRKGENIKRKMVDHKNGRTLDNQRQNLRSCSNRENQENQHATRGRSKCKGVCWHKGDQTWHVRFTLKGERLFLGSFKKESKAKSVAKHFINQQRSKI